MPLEPTFEDVPRLSPRSAASWEAALKMVFAVFREHGVQPYPVEGFVGAESEADDVVASFLAPHLVREAGDPETPEQGVRPQRWLGLSNQRAPAPWGEEYSPVVEVTPMTEQYGWVYQIVSDIARVGAGVFRRYSESDLAWEYLFPAPDGDGGREVPDPETMLLWMGGNYNSFGRFTLLSIFCGLRGVRLTPTLWDYGGGSNPDWPEGSGDLSAEEAEGILAEAYPYYVSGWYNGRQGWSPWYWDLGMEEATEDLKSLERHLLHAYADDTRERECLPYLRRCAIRRRLGLAAYGTGIGRYLAALQRALSGCNRPESLPTLGLRMPSFSTLFPAFIMSNEVDTFLCGRGRETRVDNQSTNEAAWQYLCVVVPIRLALGQEVKFALPSLASYAAQLSPVGLGEEAMSEGDERELDRQAKYQWLGDLLKRAIPKCLELLQYAVKGSEVWGRDHEIPFDPDRPVEDSTLSTEDYQEREWLEAWEEEGALTGYQWPRADAEYAEELLDLGATDLVHLAGFHFYHAWDHTVEESGEVVYRPEAEVREDGLLEDVRQFLRLLARDGREYAELGWWISEMGVPAEAPWSEEQIAYGTRYLEGANEEWQAAAVARRLVLLRALDTPPRMVLWWTGMSGATNSRDTWAEFSSMGIRMDTLNGVGGFFKEIDAYPRPAWYTFRRVAWLLSRSGPVTALEKDFSRVFILEFSSPWAGFDGAIVAFTYDESSTLKLKFSARRAHQISLVPTVPPPSEDSAEDMNFYPTPDSVDWGVAPDEFWSDEDGSYEVEVRAGERALVCVLFRSEGEDLGVTILD